MNGNDASARIRAGWVSLAAGSVIFAGKLAAFGLTGSTAVLSDALESVVNVVASGLLVLSLIVAARPADRDHPYGHGKVELLSVGIEGTLILVAAVLIGVEAVRDLVSGPVLQRLDLGVAILVVFSVGNAALGTYLIRVGRRTHSAALVADGRHVLVDVWTTAGVILGLALVSITGWALLDPIVALAVAVNILVAGWRLARDAVHGLMDRADEGLLGQVATRLQERRAPEWIDVHGLRAWSAGASVHIDFHMQVPRYFTAEQLHDIHASLESVLTEVITGEGDLVIHFDPCRPQACSGCAVAECPVRSAPLEAHEEITPTSATRADPEVDHGFGSGHASIAPAGD